MPLTPRLPLFAATLTLLALMLAAVALNAALPPAAQAQTTTTTAIDYDRNDDGLIEITTLAQLNAIRWDLNGDGAVAAVDQANYAAAFPNAAAGMGCPDGSDADTNPDPCKGYELQADLTFDSNGDGRVTAADSGGLYWNGGAGWTPIAGGSVAYTGEFQGRGKTISHLFISNSSAAATVGLFGSIGRRGQISGLGLEQVSIASSNSASAGSVAGINQGTITSSYASGTISATTGDIVAGGLVGTNFYGTAQASYADVAVSVRADGSTARVGGLVGHNLLGDIQANYATGAVSAHGTTLTAQVGGLVGTNEGTITASYARGPVAFSGSAAAGGGLVGANIGTGRATASYWDTATSGQAASPAGTGQTSSALKTPTGYTGIYASWNLNLDGAAGGDKPWYFGAANQYPIPVYGAVRDYDADNDQLIEVDNLTQLNAIRWDLNGDGVTAAANAANYVAAFPNAATGMGCADGATAAACIGYELQTDLDFDTNGNGSIDANDQFWNNGLGWQHIGEASWFYDSTRNISTLTGGFEGTFQGNGKTIANLYINQPPSSDILEAFGLFEYIGATGVIDSVNLRDVNIHIQAAGWPVGTLVGGNYGTIRSSSAVGSINLDGGVSRGGLAGGLVGSNDGAVSKIIGSYANVDIEGNGIRVGGLVGLNNSGSIVASYSTGAVGSTGSNVDLGGLVGQNYGSITTSYSLSPVKATGTGGRVGGLVGSNVGLIGDNLADTVASSSVGLITASYAAGPVVATGNGSMVGGLLGSNSAAIIASYSLSPVKATGNGAYVGGLVGYNGRWYSRQLGAITASYAAGPVVATGTNPSVGGLVGRNGWLDQDGKVRANSEGTATNSYWDTEVSGQSSSPLGTGKTTAELTAPTGYSGIYASWNLNLDGKAGNDDPWDFTRHYPKLKYGGINRLDQLYIRIYFEDLVLYPLVGDRMKTSLNAGPGLTRATPTNTPGVTSSAFVWERSDDGVTGWTVVHGPGVGSDRRGFKTFLLVPEPSEANKRFRVRVLSVERGWIYSYPTPPVKASWTGATATLGFASGHNPPRVGQPITVGGGFAVWIRCNDTAGNSCAVIGDAPGITPNASEQGKYLYAYRYYTDSNGVLTKASTGFIGPVRAAASPSP